METTEKTYRAEDAATYLGISRRTLESMEIGSREEYRATKNGSKRLVRVYDESELERVKKARETPLVTPTLSMQTGAADFAPVVKLEDLQKFAGMLIEGVQAENQKLLAGAVAEQEAAPKKKIDFSAFKDKLVLNLSQAIALSGLGRDELIEALDEQRIAGKKHGNRWRIHRASLEEFCRDYFNN